MAGEEPGLSHGRPVPWPLTSPMESVLSPCDLGGQQGPGTGCAPEEGGGPRPQERSKEAGKTFLFMGSENIA